MSNDDADDAVFKALGHRVRRRILDFLKTEPRTTGMLCDLMPEHDRCTVMQHLKVLEDAELVFPIRKGRERWNHLNVAPIQEIHERWIGPHAAHATARLAKLKRDLERSP